MRAALDRFISIMLTVAILAIVWLVYIELGFDGDYPWNDSQTADSYVCSEAIGLNVCEIQATPIEPKPVWRRVD